MFTFYTGSDDFIRVFTCYAPLALLVVNLVMGKTAKVQNGLIHVY